MRILLLGGGWSEEQDVSLSGARAVQRALLDLGHEVRFLDPARDLHNIPEAAQEADFAFINLHGRPGEDGLLQALLEAAGCPYQGSSAAGSALALNKAASKSLLKSAGLATPSWEFLPLPPDEGWETGLELPVFIKPNTGGSSLGIAVASGPEELREALRQRLELKEEILLEERIEGLELTCAVLGREALPPILVRPPSRAGFFDFASKYTPQGAEEICPAPVGESLTGRIAETALRVHDLLGLEGYSRTDFLYDGRTLYVLEANTLPGLTETSLLPLAAREQGYSFPELISRLIDLGMQRRLPESAPETGRALGRAGAS